MKKNYTIQLLILIAFISVVGCETDTITFKGPDHIKFTEESITEKESFGKPVKIEVHLVGTAPKSDITINYAISGSAREGVDYNILGERGKVVIPSGKYFGNIEVELINNANNILRTQDVVFKLEGSDANLQVGQGESAIGRTATLTIEDDCILGGIYSGKRSAFSIPVEDIKITSTDCETYTLSNWNIGLLSIPISMDLQFIDNGDNTITIPEQEEEQLPEDIATISGYGVVDPLTRKITLTVVLVDLDGQPEFTITYTPN